MLRNLKKISYLQVFFIVCCALVVSTIIFRDLPFFWDAISKSARANWIYDNDLKQFIIPTEFNSGHPPLWIAMLAIFWTVFGKSILTARILLLIINIGVFWQISRLCKNNFINGISAGAMLLVCLEPTLVAQTTSLNNDMLLLFFTLFSLNSLINQKPFLFTLALMGLLFTNLRGIYLFTAILIIHAIYLRYRLISNNKATFSAYVIAAVSFGFFCVLQFRELGWFLITENTNYNQHRQTTGIKNVVINSIVYAKSYLEYGRFIIFLALMPLLYKYIKEKSLKNLLIDRMGIALFVISIVLFFGMVPFSNPIGNRYFMVCYILAIIVLINLIFLFQIKYKNVMLSAVVICFLSGHFWIYPATISQPWDSTLAYLRYFPLEVKMENYIKNSELEISHIGTRIRLNERDFSALQPLSETDKYAHFNIQTNAYILLSNIENYTKDDELLKVQNEWELLETFSDCGVFISLYKNPKLQTK
ncbi:hypothetical protein ACFSQP_03805 [Bizionia sediminis]|uniref:Glycosyltransferase RgtA/B/C/D-like domain-containing protein n=1 Tax=Bizionia sediminis TaxID=1737064 RepID=A0ABW5KRE0_9FLAO